MNVFALKVINCNMCSDAGESNVWFITLVSVPVHMTCWPFIYKSGGRRANCRLVQDRRLVRYGQPLVVVLGFTTLLTSQVISVAFYSERVQNPTNFAQRL